MHVLITRPEPDASEWRKILSNEGIASTVEPMLDIVLAPPGDVVQGSPETLPQALVVTSRNAVRWLATAPDLSFAATLPVFTVGPGSTAAVRDLGFTDVRQGQASARDLLPVIAASARRDGGRLLHLSGDKLAFDLGPPLAAIGLTLDRRIVYRSDPARALAPETIRAIADDVVDTVILLSPSAARTLTSIMATAGLAQHHQRLVYVCLSQNIADQIADQNPRRTIVAAAPRAEAVMAALKTLAADRAC